MRPYLLLLIMVLTSLVASGQSNQVHSFYSGFGLLRDCGSYVLARKQQATRAQIEAATICAGYVMGISDAHDELTASNQSLLWCPPIDVTVGQLVNPVHRYIMTNPEDVHLSAYKIIVLALQYTYPCE